MITVWIDEILPCLKDNITGEIVDTVVRRIKDVKDLSNYTKANGWATNWKEEFLKENFSVYALYVKGHTEIEGLVSVAPSKESRTAFVGWMCTNPRNNKTIVSEQRYTGVGGHLFAIAAHVSLTNGYGGAIEGYAANKALVNHYCKIFGAIHIGQMHEYQIFIDEPFGRKIMEVYTYEYRDDEF